MIFNLTKNVPLSRAPFYAVRMWDRARGMILRDFDGFDAMVFQRCGAIHTFFMRMPIDVIFLDRENTVVRICEALPPWRPCIMAPHAVAVIEMASGAVRLTGTEPGDRLDLAADTEARQQNRMKRATLQTCGGAFERSNISRRSENL